jgi:hypothetical protein
MLSRVANSRECIWKNDHRSLPQQASDPETIMNMSSATTHHLADPSIEIEVVAKALAGAAEPVTAQQLRDRLTGPYKLSPEKLAQLLEDLVSAGSIYRFAPKAPSKKPRYWSRSVDEYARETILNLLAQRPLTQAEILKSLKAKLTGYDERRQIELLKHLRQEKLVKVLPPFLGGRTLRFGRQSPDPCDYVQDAIKKIGKRLGLPAEEVLYAARTLPVAHLKRPRSQKDLSEKLLAQIMRIKLAAAQGELVPLDQLWRSLQNEGWDKASFDRTVLSLAEENRVSLQRHNFPYGLGDQERAQLVADEWNNYYVGIALR